MRSRRLPWTSVENPLARREAERRAAGASLLDLTVTNPTQVGLPTPAAALAEALGDPRSARYDPAPLGMAGARAAVAADHGRRGAAVDPDAVTLTASSSESYALLLKVLCDPGDVVLVPQPSYPLFDHLLRLEGVEPRPYRLFFDGQWRIDPGSLDTRGARAIVVVNPNNPTGSFVTRAELDSLGRLASEQDLALIVDEVFADYVLAAPDDAVLTVTASEPAALTFSLGGLSKACGLPQMKLGWIVALGPAPAVRDAMRSLELAADTYLSVSTPVQLALPRLLEIGAGIRRDITARVTRNRQALQHRMGASSPCTLLPAEGGWAAILRLPATHTDEAWALRLLGERDVLVSPGYFFDLSQGTTVVLSLLVDPGTFDEGARRVIDLVSA